MPVLRPKKELDQVEVTISTMAWGTNNIVAIMERGMVKGETHSFIYYNIEKGLNSYLDSYYEVVVSMTFLAP